MKNARIVSLVVALGFGLFLSACGTPSTQENSSLTDPTNLQANASGNGLNAEYFSTINFTGSSLKRIVPNLNVDFGASAPIPGIDANIFSIRFTGQLSAPTTGKYTFYVTATDGDRLTLGSQIVLEDFTNLFEANFRLKAGSPATDAALVGQSPTIDVSWSPRPKGRAADIGAWESR
jgi:PA14 domain